jgi:molecular chaperone GrpE (heat shock protein)
MNGIIETITASVLAVATFCFALILFLVPTPRFKPELPQEPPKKEESKEYTKQIVAIEPQQEPQVEKDAEKLERLEQSLKEIEIKVQRIQNKVAGSKK